MARVYLDASFVSACVSSREDTRSLYRKETSLEWMETQAYRHALFVSPEVLLELSSPEFRHRVEAMSLVADIPSLVITDEVLSAAQVLVNELVMPSPVAGDAVHVALCMFYRMDFLLSWNVRHLANPNKLKHLEAVCLRLGFTAPRIITPELLWDTNP